MGHTIWAILRRVIYTDLVNLMCKNLYGLRMIVAMKTKSTLLSRVVVAGIALLWLLFWYQNAAVLYLNVDDAIFANLVTKKTMVILV